MPLYDATCSKCEHTQEYTSSVNDRDTNLPSCDKCGATMSRTIANPSRFVLKGKGWWFSEKIEDGIRKATKR